MHIRDCRPAATAMAPDMITKPKMMREMGRNGMLTRRNEG